MKKHAHLSQRPKAPTAGRRSGKGMLVAVERPEELEVAAIRDRIWAGLNGGADYARSHSTHSH